MASRIHGVSHDASSPSTGEEEEEEEEEEEKEEEVEAGMKNGTKLRRDLCCNKEIVIPVEKRRGCEVYY